MPGPTTTGVIALLQGEGWQFVPPVDLQNGWGVVTPPGQLFYRYREPGFVDIIGVVDGGTPGSVIATLPEGYRPGSDVFIPVVGDTTAGGTTASSAGILWLRSSGDLGAQDGAHLAAQALDLGLGTHADAQRGGPAAVGQRAHQDAARAQKLREILPALRQID